MSSSCPNPTMTTPLVWGAATLVVNFLTSPKALFSAAALAALNFALFSSIFDVLILAKLKWKFPKLFGKPAWVSNITGTPTAMDNVTVAAVGPYPELNDFNAISANGLLPMVLKGRPPKCKYWSIQVFLKGGGEDVKGDTIICDREFDLDSDGFFTLTISNSKPQTGSWINSGSANAAKLFGIRCFKMASGTGWKAPMVFHNDKQVLFANADRVAGGAAVSLASGSTGSLFRLSRTITFNFALLLYSTLTQHDSNTTFSILAGVVGAKWLRQAMLKKLRMKYSTMFEKRGMVENRDVALPGAKASLAGSARHAYYSMRYNASSGDVLVEGVMSYEKKGVAQWRYASVTCYDYTSLPLAGFFDDETLYESKKATKEKGKKKFEVVLTANPQRRWGVNEIDVSGAIRGICVVRLVYPEEAVLEEVKPTIKAASS